MKKKPVKDNVGDVDRQLAALRRAGQAARKLAEATGTPFIVVRDGKVVNLNPGKKRSRKIA